MSDAAPERSGAGRRLVVAGVIAAAVVAVDQVTKTWAEDRLPRGPIHVVWRLDLVLELNSGGSFGVAQGWAPALAVVAVVIAAALVVGIRRAPSWGMAAALGLVLGGALGNLTDRTLRGHHGAVIDFIALHFWPTFNVADSCVVVGGMLVAFTLVRPRPERRSPPGGADPSASAPAAADP